MFGANERLHSMILECADLSILVAAVAATSVTMFPLGPMNLFPMTYRSVYGKSRRSRPYRIRCLGMLLPYIVELT